MHQLPEIPGLRRSGYDPIPLIVLAPDSFKGSLSAAEACLAMKEGIREILPHAHIIEIPMSDGGEGFTDCLLRSVPGEFFTVPSHDPLMRPIAAQYGVIHDGSAAVMEMASAAGLTLLSPEERNPLKTTTYGVGELILAALDAGARKIIIGVGGSSTCDGGAGMAQALGVRFLDGNDAALPPGLAGGDLRHIQGIEVKDIDPRIAETSILCACDVTNPFTGPTGAAQIFAPQKGASPTDVETLEEGLQRLHDVIKTQQGVDLNSLPGSGAAGGLGGGLAAFLGAELTPGHRLIMDAAGFRKKISGASLILTGEGCLDAQTAMGKCVAGVLEEAKAAGVPVIAFAGRLGPGHEELKEQGLTKAVAIAPPELPLEEAMKNAASLLKAAVRKTLNRP